MGAGIQAELHVNLQTRARQPERPWALLSLGAYGQHVELAQGFGGLRRASGCCPGKEGSSPGPTRDEVLGPHPLPPGWAFTWGRVPLQPSDGPLWASSTLLRPPPYFPTPEFQAPPEPPPSLGGKKKQFRNSLPPRQIFFSSVERLMKERKPEMYFHSNIQSQAS